MAYHSRCAQRLPEGRRFPSATNANELDKLVEEKALYESKEELFEAFSKEFYDLTPEYCKKLVSSMPRRIQSVIEAKGGYTKY